VTEVVGFVYSMAKRAQLYIVGHAHEALPGSCHISSTHPVYRITTEPMRNIPISAKADAM
jgi:hypothetical protein